MHSCPNDVTEGEKSGGDGDPMSLAGFEHRLCPVLVERDGRDDGAPLFGRNFWEGMSANQLVLVRLEIDGGDSAAETTSILGHAFFDGARKGIGCDGLRAPALDPFLAQHFLEILDGILTSQEGKEVVGELMESHSVTKIMSRANE